MSDETMGKRNWTEADAIVDLLEEYIDFGHGGACVKEVVQTTDITNVVVNPLDFQRAAPNTIYVDKSWIHINYELNSSVFEDFDAQRDEINWTDFLEHRLGLNLSGLAQELAFRNAIISRVSGGYFRINGPDEDSCFDVREYYLAEIEILYGV